MGFKGRPEKKKGAKKGAVLSLLSRGILGYLVVPYTRHSDLNPALENTTLLVNSSLSSSLSVLYSTGKVQDVVICTVESAPFVVST